jgi:D-arabinose 1-dehydrogenase-like Zn-dependent alcohol dehydrogenase
MIQLRPCSIRQHSVPRFPTAAEAYAKLMAGKARFRMVLTMDR